MDAAGTRKDSISGYARKAFIDQMGVGCATAERVWIRPARIAILRLDDTNDTAVSFRFGRTRPNSPP